MSNFKNQGVPRLPTSDADGNSHDRNIVTAISLFEKVVPHQGITNFTAAHFVAKCHAVNSSRIPSLPLALGIVFL